MAVCYKSLISVFHFPFTFWCLHLYYVPFHTSHICIMKLSVLEFTAVFSHRLLFPHVYHSPLPYCIFRSLSSHLTWTIFVYIYVLLHTISYFLLRSTFPSHCILYPRFSLNTPMSAVTDGRASGTKNIEIKKNSCV
jgi:hypothetical protein